MVLTDVTSHTENYFRGFVCERYWKIPFIRGEFKAILSVDSA
ncbi:hypothetical protein JCM19238_1819 [Vibrio ponticus]|nr:hypothetical protein JCM19238_1819 [Vibrio ponticus]